MTINQQNARAKAAYKTYQLSDKDLYSAYSRPSKTKAAIWYDCYRQMTKANGFGLRVVSRNCHIFTCGYCYRDKKTGALHFVYITPSYITDVEVEG